MHKQHDKMFGSYLKEHKRANVPRYNPDIRLPKITMTGSRSQQNPFDAYSSNKKEELSKFYRKVWVNCREGSCRTSQKLSILKKEYLYIGIDLTQQEKMIR